MSKFRQVQSSFAYGMLSEEAAARSDLDFIKQGCSELTNFVVEPIGGIRKRLGFKMVATSLVNYQFCDVNFYPIKGSDKYLMIGNTSSESFFYLLNNDFSIKQEIAVAFRGLVLSLVQVGDIIIFTATNKQPQVIYPDEGIYQITPYYKFLIRGATDNGSLALQYKFLPFNEWNINGSESVVAAATSGDTTLSFLKNSVPFPYFGIPNFEDLVAANYFTTVWVKALWQSRLTTNYFMATLNTASAGFTLTFSSGDDISQIGTMLVTCRNTNNPNLTSGVQYYLKPTGTPYTYNVATTFTNLVTGNFVAITASSYAVFSVDKISALPVKTLIAPPNTNATTSWSVPEWNYTNGYPLKISFVGTRLCFAGNKADSEAIWLSAAVNILQFNNLRFKIDETATSSEVGLFGARGDIDAHKTRATSAQFNRTSWILNADELTVGCQGGIFILNRSNTGDYLPQKTTSSALSYDSAADIEPTMMEFGIVFVDSSRTRVKFIDFRSDKKGVSDISLLTGEIFTFISKIIYQRSTKTLWILDDGSLKSFTLSTFTNVAGFATHGVQRFEMVYDIFLDQEDRLCLGLFNNMPPFRIAVSRVEAESLGVPSQYLDHYYTDISLTNITVWTIPDSRFNILEADTVPCIVDGISTTGVFSNNGVTFTTAIAGKNLIIGYPYTARMKTVSLDPGGTLGSAVGALKRPDEVVLKVKATQNMKVGGKTLYMSKSTATLYSGDISEKVAADPSYTSIITVESSDNYPCHILSITYKGFTQE